MPIRLTTEEAAFIDRVLSYCREGLNQPQMADREDITVSGLRQKLARFGFEVEAKTEREVVRLRTGETYDALKAAGQIVTPEPSLAEVAA